jgi:phosphoglycerate dehydrogenase-like enzyme
VAETAIALITGVYRGLPRRYKEVLSGKWTRKALPRLSGKTIGLVGLGRIGRAMVPRCVGLGLNVIAFEPLAGRPGSRGSVGTFFSMFWRSHSGRSASRTMSHLCFGV